MWVRPNHLVMFLPTLPSLDIKLPVRVFYYRSTVSSDVVASMDYFPVMGINKNLVLYDFFASYAPFWSLNTKAVVDSFALYYQKVRMVSSGTGQRSPGNLPSVAKLHFCEAI